MKIYKSLSLTTTIFCFQGYRSLGRGSQLHYSGDGPEPAGPVPPRASLDEQIVAALARVQEDIQSVLERMRTVEALTTNLVRSRRTDRQTDRQMVGRMNVKLKVVCLPFCCVFRLDQ